MASTVLMPKQGNTVESCILLEWKKQEGDTINEGDILCEAETDKATIEVESTASGTVLKLLYAVDDEVPVMQPIAVIGEPGEDISSLVDESAAPQEKPKQESDTGEEKEEKEEKKAEPAAEAAEEQQKTASGSSPRARNTASAKQVDISGLSGSGPGGRVIERDVLEAASGRTRMTPAAAQRAAEEGRAVPAEGTGIGGRVRLADLDRAPVEAAAEAAADFLGGYREVALKSIRKLTAERMYDSLQQTAQLSMTASADASALLAFRKRCKESDESLGMQGITINDLLLFAVSRSLLDFPYMNSHFLGDKTLEFEHVHLGIAVDTPRGLMVPVVPYADMRSLVSISQEAKKLASECLEGKAKPEYFEGGTFTVTNLGAFGIQHFTPVINTPQTAILGVNTIEQKPAEKDGEIVLKPEISFSLTFDHQAVDGAPAARFLQGLVRFVESIDLLTAR